MSPDPSFLDEIAPVGQIPIISYSYTSRLYKYSSTTWSSDDRPELVGSSEHGNLLGSSGTVSDPTFGRVDVHKRYVP